MEDLLKIVRTPLMLLVLVLITAGTSFYFFNQYRQSQERIRLLENPQEAARIESAKLTDAVGKLITLPSDETPTVATVTDKERLKDQSFFANAENGDKVLIYTQAKKAILYRPSTNKIIDVAPVNIGTASATPAAAKVRVAIYNGTTTAGLANTTERDLTQKVTNIEVVAKANAKKNDYEKTLVIDLTGNLKSVAQQLAKVLGGETASLPKEETKPTNADILVIIGK